MTENQDRLEEVLKNVRALEPSDALKARLEHALLAAERSERTRMLEARHKRAAWLGHLRLSLPAFASVAIAAHLLVAQPDYEPSIVAEHRLDMPEQGHGALPLSLSLGEHDSEFAAVRLGVPHGMRVTPSDQAISARRPSCNREGCVYEFVHPTGTLLPHLEVQSKSRAGIASMSSTLRTRKRCMKSSLCTRDADEKTCTDASSREPY